MILKLLLLLYTVQGIPYGFQSRFLPIYLRTHGLSLSQLSSLKLLYIPWVLKTLWAPMIDSWKTKRWWLQTSMGGLMVTCIALGLLKPERLWCLAALMLAQNLLASVQDIAVDALAITTLSSSQLGDGNVAQVVGYKFGAIIGGGVLVTLSQWVPWSVLFCLLAGMYSAALLVVGFAPALANQRAERDRRASAAPGAWWKTVSESLANRRTAVVGGFVLVYKLGEQGAMNMLPLFLVDSGVSLSNVGFWTGIVGQVTSIAGSALAGIAIRRYGSHRVLTVSCWLRLPLLLALCALTRTPASDWRPSVLLMNCVLLISGLITTAAFSIMMQCSQLVPDHCKATHYTSLATLEVLGKLAFSTVSGFIVDSVGYANGYLLFLLLAAAAVAHLRWYRAEFSEICQQSEDSNKQQFN